MQSHRYRQADIYQSTQHSYITHEQKISWDRESVSDRKYTPRQFTQLHMASVHFYTVFSPSENCFFAQLSLKGSHQTQERSSPPRSSRITQYWFDLILHITSTHHRTKSCSDRDSNPRLLGSLPIFKHSRIWFTDPSGASTALLPTGSLLGIPGSLKILNHFWVSFKSLFIWSLLFQQKVAMVLFFRSFFAIQAYDFLESNSIYKRRK